MTTWTKTDWALEAVINGREYQIQKSGKTYSLYCDGELYWAAYDFIADAKAAADEHAAAPTPAKQGVHMDDVAGQQLMDILKRSFTWQRIQDFGDLSPYDEPDTGAPEPGV